MGDNGDEKVIGLPKDGRLPSPSDILADPRRHLDGRRGAIRPVTPRAQERPAEPQPAARADGDDENPGGGPESFDDQSPDYKAFGWAGSKTLPILRIIYKDFSEGLIVYAHIDTNPVSGSQFLPHPPNRKGQIIFLRVVGHDGVFMLAIEGLRLRRVWELMLGHRTPWIHELPDGADFEGDDDPVIWSITARGPIKA